MNLPIANKLSITLILLVSFTTWLPLYAMDPQFELSPQLVINAKNNQAAEKKPQAVVTADKKTVAAKAPTKTHHHSKTKQSKKSHLAAPETTPKVIASGSAIPVGLLPAWEKLVSSSTAELPAGLLSFDSEAFSLTLDPSKYPMLPAQDGSTILLDPNGTLPPLVRVLIQEKGRSLKVVGSPQQDGKKFLGELLGASGFYSVEEKPLLEFGNDPRLTVRADFKVERNSDSLVRNDLVILNASHYRSSPNLAIYLRNEGVSLLEPFVDKQQSATSSAKHRLFTITPRAQSETVDAVLGAISIKFEKNRRLEIFSVAENGFALSVQTDRYFEHAGKRYVITRFTGDPIAYTLLRLLETKGYRVVILKKQDAFRTVAEKMLSKMDMTVSYAPQLLVSDPEGKYSIELSGVLLENPLVSGGTTVLTDRIVEPGMRAVLADHGYKIEER